MTSIDRETATELEAAAFRRLVAHLRQRTDVQNIDLMNLAGFCRNCLSRWYREEAEKTGVPVSDPQAREIVYGAPLLHTGGRYDPATDTYTYVWKTDKAWANTCRELLVKLKDASVHTAVFHFVR